MKEAVTGVAVGAGTAAGRVAGTLAGVATDCVAGGVALRWVVDAELRVIENVEGFDAKLDVALVRQAEVLEQGEIEVGAMRIVEHIAPGVPEGEPAGRCKS